MECCHCDMVSIIPSLSDPRTHQQDPSKLYRVRNESELCDWCSAVIVNQGDGSVTLWHCRRYCGNVSLIYSFNIGQYGHIWNGFKIIFTGYIFIPSTVPVVWPRSYMSKYYFSQNLTNVRILGDLEDYLKHFRVTRFTWTAMGVARGVRGVCKSFN